MLTSAIARSSRTLPRGVPLIAAPLARQSPRTASAALIRPSQALQRTAHRQLHSTSKIMAIHELVDTDTFQKVVLEEGANSSDLILVDFVASWCGPCKVLSPILHRIAEDASQGISLVTVDVDQQPELAQAFQVTAMPTVISFKSGKPLKMFKGALPEAQVKAFITDCKA